MNIRTRNFRVILVMAVLLFACNLLPSATGFAPSPTSPAPTDTELTAPTPLHTSPADTPLPEPGGTPGLPDETILILQPGPGSVVTSPVQVAGIADPTFEQALVVRILLADGTALATQPAQIQAEMGQRGPFGVEISFELADQQQGFIQVYASSPRDGGITHLTSVGVALAGSGEADIILVAPHPERINIYSPASGETISGGIAYVEGFALASFEQTLLIEILDQDGLVIGSQPVIVQALDLGLPGPFRAELKYQLDTAGPGRVVVRDMSPAFGGDSHRASVEIRLEP